MQVLTAVTCVAMMALAILPAAATMRITSDPGGQIGPYLENLASLRSSGEHVVIQRSKSRGEPGEINRLLAQGGIKNVVQNPYITRLGTRQILFSISSWLQASQITRMFSIALPMLNS